MPWQHIMNGNQQKGNKKMMDYRIVGLSEEESYQQILNTNLDALTQAQHPSEKYSDSTGWCDVLEWADEAHLEVIEHLAKEIRSKANAFVLIGVGGSNNAARSVIEAIQEDHGIEIIYAGNTLSAHALKKMLDSLDGKDVYINCIAKNFATLEPGSSFRLLREYLNKRYGNQANERILVTGTKGSELEEICKKHHYTFLEFPHNIGGRYTALSNVGLLPMAVAGIDIRALVQGAKDMQKELHDNTNQTNLAYRYACMRNLMYQKGYTVEMLSSFEPQLHYFNYWWTQLFGESEGKENKGIFPTTGEFSEQLHSIGQYIQDGSPILFETFLKVKEINESVYPKADEVEDFFNYLNDKDFRMINNAAYEATLEAHSRKFACGELSIERIDAYHFGQMFYFFAFACVVSCYIMGVNPFDQPGVEAYKEGMFKALGK